MKHYYSIVAASDIIQAHTEELCLILARDDVTYGSGQLVTDYTTELNPV